MVSMKSIKGINDSQGSDKCSCGYTAREGFGLESHYKNNPEHMERNQEFNIKRINKKIAEIDKLLEKEKREDWISYWNNEKKELNAELDKMKGNHTNIPKTIVEALESYRHDDGKGYENIYFPQTVKLKKWTIINRITHAVEFESKRKVSLKVKKRLNEASRKWDVWATNGGIIVAEKSFASSKEDEAIDYAKDLMEALS
jgi:hypothetical protein